MSFIAFTTVTALSALQAIKAFQVSKQEAPRKPVSDHTALDVARWFLEYTDGYLSLSHAQVVRLIVSSYDAYGMETGEHLFDPDTFWNHGFPTKLDCKLWFSPFTAHEESILRSVAKDTFGTLYR